MDCYKNPHKWKEKEKKEPERWQYEKDSVRPYGFKGGSMWPQAKDCGWPLESGISKKRYYLLDPLKGAQSCQNLEFSPLRPIVDF